MAKPAPTFLLGVTVTHDVIGGEYIVLDSRQHYTQVITNDDQAVDISFPTEDLRILN